MRMPEERLIYADDFLDLFYVASAGQDKAFISAIEMVMKDTPTIDAVEVVRCKDCRFSAPSYASPELYRQCSLSIPWKKVAIDFFCAHGERNMDAEVHDDA